VLPVFLLCLLDVANSCGDSRPRLSVERSEAPGEAMLRIYGVATFSNSALR
jgi:hypothetical protein